MSKSIIAGNPDFKRTVPAGETFVDVSEFFFDTIQGEGITLGHPAAFLRVQSCTLACLWCFGIKKGRRIPRITTLNGLNKKINEVEIGDILLTFDEKTKELCETTVTNTLSREVTEWYEIVIEGTQYYVTPEHPFFTTDGLLKRADELKRGDEIYHSDSKQKLSYKMKHYNPMFNEISVKKSKDNTDWEQLGKKISQTINRKKKDGFYINSINILKERDPEKYREFTEKISSRQKGELNSNWCGGVTLTNFNKLKKDIYGEKLECSRCKNLANLEVHHIDHNYENDSLENLITICHSCHSQEHQRGYNFWNGNRKDSKISSTGAEAVMNGLKVNSIKRVDIKKDPHYGRSYGPKSLPVFNLTCEPHNSYLVDDMWVHNCDTQEVWRFGNPYTITELLDLMDSSGLAQQLEKGQHLVLTGGSPLKQQKKLITLIEAFIHRFKFKPYIEVENECVLLPYDEMVDFVDCWNNSPKLENSGNVEMFRYQPNVLAKMSSLDNSWFKFVVGGEEEWQEIQEKFLDTNLIRRDQIILMPLGATREELQETRERAVQLAIREGVRYCTREHVILWDKKTGV